jgi:V/A-type H+-transporting ATPase subunit K
VAAETTSESRQDKETSIAAARAAGSQSAVHSTDDSEINWQDMGKAFAAAIAISATAFATAMTQCRIGSAGVGALAENPKLFASILIYLVIPETMVILGFVIAALIIL